VASFLVEDLLKAGVHFGHKVSRWNPRMEPYIFAKRNQIHIIDLKETVKGIIRSCRFLTNVVADGGEVLFVGTKRQARSAVESEGHRCEMHIVTDRWIGGTLTNFTVIRSRLKRLIELEVMEEDGTINEYSKKMVSSLRREMRKIKRNLDGIRRMQKAPGVMVIVDPTQEINAVREAIKMNIPVIAIIDTDGNPGIIDIPIPGNDDAIRSIQTILSVLTDSVLQGKELCLEREMAMKKVAEEEAARRKAEEAARRAKADAERAKVEAERAKADAERAKADADKKAVEEGAKKAREKAAEKTAKADAPAAKADAAPDAKADAPDAKADAPVAKADVAPPSAPVEQPAAPEKSKAAPVAEKAGDKPESAE